jgi:hypothetical protein
MPQRQSMGNMYSIRPEWTGCETLRHWCDQHAFSVVRKRSHVVDGHSWRVLFHFETPRLYPQRPVSNSLLYDHITQATLPVHVIAGWCRRWCLTCHISPAQPAIHHKFSRIDEAALIARKE